jgi:hypothetical protein
MNGEIRRRRGVQYNFAVDGEGEATRGGRRSPSPRGTSSRSIVVRAAAASFIFKEEEKRKKTVRDILEIGKRKQKERNRQTDKDRHIERGKDGR